MRTSRGFSATADLHNSAFSSNFGTTRRWSSRVVELLTTRTFELSSSRHLDISATRRSTPLLIRTSKLFNFIVLRRLWTNVHKIFHTDEAPHVTAGTVYHANLTGVA